MSKKDIVFVLCPKCEIESPPLNVSCLCGYVRNQGFSVGVYDLNVECYLNRGEKYKRHWEVENQEFWTQANSVESYFNDNLDIVDRLLKYIEQEKPLALGFPNWFVSFESNIYIARKIKEKNPQIKLIFGGPDVSIRLMTGRLARKDYMFIDAFVLGEGELTLAELLTRFKKRESIIDCHGVASFQENNLRMRAQRQLIPDLSILPPPDYSDFNFENYTTKGTHLATHFSRGCINKCIYCDERVLWGVFRTKSGKQFFQEVKELKNKYPFLTHLTLNDSLVNGSIKELTEFCRLMTENPLGLTWGVFAIIRKEMEPDLLRLMKSAGCSRLMYGVESVSRPVLEKVGKVMTRGCDIEKIIRDTADAGIQVWTNFMFGLPGETEEDAQQNIDFVIRNKKYIHSVSPTFALCNLSEFSGAHLYPEKYGIKKNVHIHYWETEDGKNNYLVRLKWFERFCTAINRAGVNNAYPHNRLVDRDKKIGYYYYYKKDYTNAVKYFKKAIKIEPWDKHLENTIKEIKDTIVVKKSLVVQDLKVNRDLYTNRYIVNFLDATESVDNLDISSYGAVRFRPGQGSIVIHGFSGGISGQVVNIFKTDWAGVVVIKHAHEKGAQKIVTKDGKALILGSNSFGGATFVYEGNFWYEIAR